jgi:hypothetical protein
MPVIPLKNPYFASALVLATGAAVLAMFFVESIWHIDSEATIKEAEEKARNSVVSVGESYKGGKIVGDWSIAEAATTQLSNTNKKIVLARTMLLIRTEQEGFFVDDAAPTDSELWPSRAEIAREPYVTRARPIQYVLTFVAAGLLTFLLILLPYFLWYFFLARIREISRALQGAE